MSAYIWNGKKITELDGIIFDVDGTLWDATDSIVESWNLAIAEHTDLKLRMTAEFMQTLFGKTMTEIADAAFPMLTKEERTRVIELCFTYENRHLETHPGNVYDGVAEVFETLAAKTDLFIVSNCQCGYVEVFLKSSGLDRYIKDHLCFGDTCVSKGKTLRILMEKNHLTDVVYIGDTLGDANACREAEIPFIFAEYGFGSVPDAKWQIHKITELTKI